jgi:hypothetical protein
LNLAPINFGTPYNLQYHKLQAVIHKKFCALKFFNHCLCT